jgi:subtilisin family serine protease
MDREPRTKAPGCWQAATDAALVLWLVCVPIGTTALVRAIMPSTASDRVTVVASLSVTAALVLAPLLVAALLARRRDGWQATAALAASTVAIEGYLLLDGVANAVLPTLTETTLHGEGAAASAVRLLVLMAYVSLAAWLTPRLARAPRCPILGCLGLNHLDLPTVFLALAVAVLVGIPWPLTGALGDSLTSLSLALRTLAYIIPQTLLVWGIVFGLLTSTLAKSWSAALLVIVLYVPTAYGNLLATGNWGVLATPMGAIPLAFLLAELRARRSGIYPVLPVAFSLLMGPLLFVDPRDALAAGSPEHQHILSYIISWSVATAAGPVLWLLRQLLKTAGTQARIPHWAGMSLTAALLLAVAGTWGLLYVTKGNPSLYNDGFLIILEEEADVSAAYEIPDREERIQYVYDTLVETADRTQAPLREELDQLGIPHRPYYLINMIRVDGHRWLASRFEDKEGVAKVILNPNTREYPNRIPPPYPEGDARGRPVPWNLSAIHADEAWQMGASGEGIVVAGQDTGYDWTHPALRPRYRGWDGQSASHDYNWHDAWDDTAEPFDDDSHGTHTMGIAVGDAGTNNRIGVAPGAQWIGCRNMRRGVGNPASYSECMEYFLAPYPHGGDPFIDGDVSMSPHIINNSWGCPYWEGCSAETLEPAMEALRAAGIMMVVSVGNDGPSCGTAARPPAGYDAVFSVGMTGNDGDIIWLSSRGPAGSLIKPDIVAPGFGIRSSVPGGEYAWAGGTSMAAPHVAGVAALMWSADPSLIGDIDATESLMCQAADPRPVESGCSVEDESSSPCACGGVTGVPNNVYGCGFVDAESAVQAAVGE